MIAYHYDNNIIHCQPLCNRKGIELKTAYQKIFKYLVHCNLTLKYHSHDDEVSKTIKSWN